MLEKFKQSLDDAFQNVKSGASKLSLRAEEKTKITRLNHKTNSLKKDLDVIMAKLGNRLYTVRQEQVPGDPFQDPAVSEIFAEADQAKEKVTALQQEMAQIREDYEMRIKSLKISPEAGEEAEKTAEAGKE